MVSERGTGALRVYAVGWRLGWIGIYGLESGARRVVRRRLCRLHLLGNRVSGGWGFHDNGEPARRWTHPDSDEVTDGEGLANAQLYANSPLYGDGKSYPNRNANPYPPANRDCYPYPSADQHQKANTDFSADHYSPAHGHAASHRKTEPPTIKQNEQLRSAARPHGSRFSC